MTSTHTCPYPDCHKSVPGEMFACGQHWYTLPDAIRIEIWRAYRRHGVGSPELAEAHAAAYEHWGQP